MKSFMFILFLLLPAVIIHSPAEEVPAHFKMVDQTLWVVQDLEKVKGEWEKLGFIQVLDLGAVTAKSESTGKPLKLKMALANLGGAQVVWIQPLNDQSVFAEFHQYYGDGAMSLVYRLEDHKAAKKEIQRLAEVGIAVLDEITIKTGAASWTYVLMDTQTQGTYVLGYVYGDDRTLTANLSSENRHQLKMTQYAFAARRPEPASSYWQIMGFPPIDVTHSVSRDRMYRGQAADFEMNLGWQRHGNIVYEWCLPLKSPTVYEDHMNKHGEGIQHFGFSTADIDGVIEDYSAKGFSVSMSGAWGEKDKPGSGRFAYIDLESAGGLTMELLWNYPGK